VAFRRGGLAVVVPRFTDDERTETAVALPRGRWRDVLTGAARDGGRHPLGVLLGGFPVAVLEAEERP
jgi:(1->4)-alpha-D-glucan 1-alpha-D-glucosylmutase